IAGPPALAPRRVRSEPGGEAERLLARSEVRVKPVAAHRRRADEPDGLVVLPSHLVALAVLPRLLAEMRRPRVGVAFARQADEYRGRAVRVRLGVAAVLVLADPEIKTVAGHVRLDAAITGRAAVVE